MEVFLDYFFFSKIQRRKKKTWNLVTCILFIIIELNCGNSTVFSSGYLIFRVSSCIKTSVTECVNGPVSFLCPLQHFFGFWFLGKVYKLKKKTTQQLTGVESLKKLIKALNYKTKLHLELSDSYNHVVLCSSHIKARTINELPATLTCS